MAEELMSCGLPRSACSDPTLHARMTNPPTVTDADRANNIVVAKLAHNIVNRVLEEEFPGRRFVLSTTKSIIANILAAEFAKVREEEHRSTKKGYIEQLSRLEERINDLLSPGPCGKHPKMFWVKRTQYHDEEIWECSICEETKPLVEVLEWALGYIGDGTQFNSFDEPHIPKHACEFTINPEKGSCEFHERWVQACKALSDFKAKQEGR